ncbi:MAG: riboflavin biosynthesis protein RibF [Bdellovibrionales bacterium]|nr:riboflavin biosynthesis protein RibF [Bdellovibrionales bacterium]
MKVCYSHSDYNGSLSGVLTLGIFDGFHLGHQKIVKQVVSRARENHCPSILMTFDPHPLTFLQPQLGVRRLFPLEDLIQQAASLGVEYLIIEKFSKGFSKLTAPVFFEQYIYKPFRPSCLTVGYDLRFGFNREGSVQSLKRWAKKYLFEVEEISPFKINGDIVSTSMLKKAFSDNDLSRMNSLMGRPFSLQGDIVSGEGRGKQLGFPTLNVQTSSLLPEKKGVYLCLLHLEQKVFPGVMNIGVNPTFSDLNPRVKVEVHLISACPQGITKGKVQVDILNYIRDEKQFDSVDSLKREIKSDVEKAKAYFNSRKL